eukprot:TRINITY_DN55712_c0_g1_i1.p1 TRINITY_DN55712_c0_g1~~TRINITY_DN55712_c0_g1_i1.p1  ORF type:complete len:351 (+),score=87.22 TRINITY_DN55712_c0_g1_i1:81-1133(+)
MLRTLQTFQCRFALRSLQLHAYRACASAARPPRSQFLNTRPAPAPGAGTSSASTASQPEQGQQKQRYGPLDVDLQPRDQLRPLLPTWNPPPTRRPKPEELEVSTRLRFCLEERWWAATVREVVGENEVKVGYDGWPSRHDETVPRDSDRLYLHESFHDDYVAPPLPQRYQRPAPTDAQGNPLPAGPRAPRPKVYDPEKERMKRALRPPLPYNPEKERLKRLLRGQYAPPVDSFETSSATGASTAEPQPQEQPEVKPVRFDEPAVEAAPRAAPPPAGPPPSPAPPPVVVVQWLEVPGGVQGERAFRHAISGEVKTGPPQTNSWVELLAEGGNRYYWHVGRNVTQWEKPQSP